jgi:hypothetical protein
VEPESEVSALDKGLDGCFPVLIQSRARKPRSMSALACWQQLTVKSEINIWEAMVLRVLRFPRTMRRRS